MSSLNRSFYKCHPSLREGSGEILREAKDDVTFAFFPGSPAVPFPSFPGSAGERSFEAPASIVRGMEAGAS